MQTQTFETSKGTLLAILLPEDAFNITKKLGRLWASSNISEDVEFILPPGDWKEIGLWGSVSEEKAKEVGLENLESLQSLLETKIYLKNPCGDKPNYLGYPDSLDCFYADYAQWEAAESEVWKHFYLIFKTK